MLTSPQRARIFWCLRSEFISASRDPKNSTTYLNGRIPNWRHFKILKFSGPSLLGMMSSTLQLHFLSGVYYDRWWLSYPFCMSVRLHQMTQSLTVTWSTTKRREIRNFPYPTMFELTGRQRLTVKRGIRNVGQFLVAKVKNPAQDESQQMFALCDRMDKEGDIQKR